MVATVAGTAAVEAQSDIDGGYAWVRLGIALALGTVGGIGMWSVVVVLPIVQAEFGIARADASLALHR